MGINRESPAALNDRVGDSKVVQESLRESLSKDRYFVIESVIGSGRGIAKRLKDPALFKVGVKLLMNILLICRWYSITEYNLKSEQKLIKYLISTYLRFYIKVILIRIMQEKITAVKNIYPIIAPILTLMRKNMTTLFKTV